MPIPPDSNPYAPPEAPLEPPGAVPPPEPIGPEEIRIAGLRQERYVRALGPLNFASAAILAVGIVFSGVWARTLVDSGGWDQSSKEARVHFIARFFVAPVLFIGLHIVLGWSLLERDPSARRWQIGLSSAVFGAFVVNRMTSFQSIDDIWAFKIVAFGIAHVGILYLISGGSGARVFSAEFRELVEATPRVTSRIGPALLAAAIIGGIAAGWGDDSICEFIGRHIAPRLVGVPDR